VVTRFWNEGVGATIGRRQAVWNDSQFPDKGMCDHSLSCLSVEDFTLDLINHHQNWTKFFD